MTDFDPAPTEEALKRAKQRWKGRKDTFARVYYAVLGLAEYTHYPEIADVADCSENSAKKHLDRLVEMGLVQRDPKLKLARYRRNEAYFEWLDASQIAQELSREEILERVEELESRRAEFEEQFDATDPSNIGLFDQYTDQSTFDRLRSLSEWQSIDRDIQLYKIAFHIASNNGHLLPV
ncbi:DUF7342 family protein [Salinigranum marinum]|uniref:DUF7342 family protein n=1 Tax=Salinigranum marinum TaxID=1515595 RepID=UPI002989F88C|nr:sugar-specific transcriptional regulator TrmB [Salinigranum marinum]